jgi:outer membrane immunogenic protein
MFKRLVLALALFGVAALGLAASASADGYERRSAPAACCFSWTGLYGGLNLGYAWGSNSDAAFTGDAATTAGAGNFILNGIFKGPSAISDFRPASYSQSLDTKGVGGGAQLGYNWQFASRWVLSLETDIQLSRVKGDATTSNDLILLPSLYTLRSEQELNWFGTVRQRFGFLASERLLVFGTGGLAYGQTKVSSNIANSSPLTGVTIPGGTSYHDCLAGTVCFAGSKSAFSTGWTAGGGFEWAWSTGASLKVEYLHVDLGEQVIVLVPVSPTNGTAFMTARFDNTFEIVRAGINMKF